MLVEHRTLGGGKINNACGGISKIWTWPIKEVCQVWLAFLEGLTQVCIS